MSADFPNRDTEERVREAFEAALDMMGGLFNVYALGVSDRDSELRKDS